MCHTHAPMTYLEDIIYCRGERVKGILSRGPMSHALSSEDIGKGHHKRNTSCTNGHHYEDNTVDSIFNRIENGLQPLADNPMIPI